MEKLKTGPKPRLKDATSNLLEFRPYFKIDSHERPALYRLVTSLRVNGQLNDVIYSLLEQYALSPMGIEACNQPSTTVKREISAEYVPSTTTPSPTEVRTATEPNREYVVQLSPTDKGFEVMPPTTLTKPLQTASAVEPIISQATGQSSPPTAQGTPQKLSSFLARAKENS